ncbi:MAG: glycine--tRNA ligase subunit alpha [bacterium JZ-2024 1]
MDFPSLIERLNRFWSRQACWIALPYDVEVGAGTMHPATFFLALGKTPARVAYPQGCRRPVDGRYGENPNRLGFYYQYQVILKPSPDEVQDLYIRSLKFLGIDLKKHDLRFVEDDWESPTLGAWGIGWEVWLDGLEVTQFTYFQQVGGQNLAVISAEITYGLERLALLLQGKKTVFELTWRNATRGHPHMTYGDWHLKTEQEFSRYNFEKANGERYRRLFTEYGEEAEALIAEGLLLPAYDMVLKMSHLFNVMDARGVVGVSDRSTLIKRIRALAVRIASLYVADEERRLKASAEEPARK